MSQPNIELLTADSLTLAALAELFEQVFLDTTLVDEAELLKIRDEIVAEVALLTKPDRVQLRAYYGWVEDVEELDRWKLLNNLNARSAFIRAFLDEEQDLVLSHSILLKGGLTKKALIEATRLFLSDAPQLIETCDEGNIVE